MPFANREDKIAYMREWRKRKIREGYGKWLYERRKLRFNDALRFQDALKRIAEHDTEDRYGDSAALSMAQIAKDALEESRKAEEALGDFESPV